MNSIEYFEKHVEIINNLPHKDIEKLKQIVEEKISDKKSIFCIGHGGSLLNIQHFSQDLLKNQYVLGRRSAKIIALGSNPGLASAMANDLDHEDAFIPELHAYSSEKDLLIAVSVSGTSRAIVKAINWAIQNKLYTVALSGNKNIKNGIASMADCSIVIQNDEFSHVEDLICKIFHYIIYNTLI